MQTAVPESATHLELTHTPRQSFEGTWTVRRVRPTGHRRLRQGWSLADFRLTGIGLNRVGNSQIADEPGPPVSQWPLHEPYLAWGCRPFASLYPRLRAYRPRASSRDNAIKWST